jgi:hypothetical protein
MLTDPIKFYQYFQIAHEQLKDVGTKKAPTEEEKKKTEKKDDEFCITDLDDVGLFLFTMPPNLVEGKEEKFKALLKELKQGKASSRLIVKKLLMR